MQPTRATQPYRRGGGRAPGATLGAMLAGKPAFLPNPQDLKRRGAKGSTGRARSPRFPGAAIMSYWDFPHGA